MSMVRQMK